jgi:hypothetical protein
MTRTFTLLLLAALASAACESHLRDTRRAPVADKVHAAAADVFTSRYKSSRLSRWGVRASAAGADCAVLFVQTSILLEDSMIEGIHYGAGTYDVFDGGVQQFYRDRKFRGVAYKDPSGRVWTYGDVTVPQAELLEPCARP